MAVTNIFTTFSESTNGTPIHVSSTTSPGVLIHTSTTELDSMWVFAGINEIVPYTESVFLQVLKGSNGVYKEDGIYKLKTGVRTPIDAGLIITSNVEYRVYIHNTSSVIPQVAISGYVHRRI
jgi:hypothetical protein